MFFEVDHSIKGAQRFGDRAADGQVIDYLVSDDAGTALALKLGALFPTRLPIIISLLIVAEHFFCPGQP